MQRIKSKMCGNHCTKIEHLDVTLDQNHILEDVNFHLYCGEMLTIIGKNGAGKSTLMKALLGEIPYQGKVLFEDMRNGKRSRIKIGYVPQHLTFDKNTPTTVYDFFAACISNKPVWLMKDKNTYRRVQKELSRFQAEGLIDQCLGDLSGGELQRVLLSVATCPMPNLLLLDEPISGIDRNGTTLFYELLDELKGKYDIAILMISHDLDFTYEYSDRVILLERTVEAEGRPQDVYQTAIFRETFGYPQQPFRPSSGDDEMDAVKTEPVRKRKGNHTGTTTEGGAGADGQARRAHHEEYSAAYKGDLTRSMETNETGLPETEKTDREIIRGRRNRNV